MKKKLYLLSIASLLVLFGCNPTTSTSLSSDSSSESSNNSTSVGSSDTSTNTTGEPQKAIFTITFNSDGGTKVPNIEAEASQRIEKPSDPIKADHRFGVWFEDYFTYEKPYTFELMPENNLVLYAKWTKIGADEVEEYNANLTRNSKKDHLYIHYRRFAQTSEDYSNWNLWIWPKNGTGRTVEFVKNSDGTIKFDEFDGAMIELDLRATYTDGGHDSQG